MKVFLSWSGSRSKAAAQAVHEWLPVVLNAVTPWMSSTDIEAGARWSRQISSELEKTSIGILFVTPSNVDAPWLIFEAGALAKTIDDSSVCPYLIGLRPAEIPNSPISQFQAKVANRDGTWGLVQMLNTALDEHALSDANLAKVFDRWWPDLEELLGALPEETTDVQQPRQVNDIVEDTLNTVRRIEHSNDKLAEGLREVMHLGRVQSDWAQLFGPDVHVGPAPKFIEFALVGVLQKCRLPDFDTEILAWKQSTNVKRRKHVAAVRKVAASVHGKPVEEVTDEEITDTVRALGEELDKSPALLVALSTLPEFGG